MAGMGVRDWIVEIRDWIVAPAPVGTSRPLDCMLGRRRLAASDNVEEDDDEEDEDYDA